MRESRYRLREWYRSRIPARTYVGFAISDKFIKHVTGYELFLLRARVRVWVLVNFLILNHAEIFQSKFTK